jgi:hypothetical protein
MPTSHDRVLDMVTERATSDLPFRKRLLDDPEGVIFSEFGVRFPSGFQIRFIEKPANLDLLVVLPDFRPHGQELDDEDLDEAAGGDGEPW